VNHKFINADSWKHYSYPRETASSQESDPIFIIFLIWSDSQLRLAHQPGATYFNKIMSWNFFSETKPLPTAPTPIVQRVSITLAVILFAALGALLNFIGICIKQARKGAARELWFHSFFYMAVLLAFSILAMVITIDQHRLTMMAFLGIGFVYLTSDINSHIDSVRYHSENATSFTGCLFMIFAWFYMMIFTGGMPSMQSANK